MPVQIVGRAIMPCLLFALFPINVFAQQETTADTLEVKILGDTECSDGIDNDSDGFIDYPEDTGCSSYEDDSELVAVVTQCSDGIDNDSDGLIDYPLDPDCESLSDDNEFTYSPPSGGGGGGGGSSDDDTSIIMQGYGYPESMVSIVKDGTLAVAKKTESDGSFKIRYDDLAAGHYTFALYIEDANGRRSTPQAFSVDIEEDETTIVSGIYFPPSISLDKEQVKHGGTITMSGYSIPGVRVVAFIGPLNIWRESATSSKSGAWSIPYVTRSVGYGDYTASAVAVTNKATTTFSKTVAFKVGLTDVYTTAEENCNIKADLNGDCRVNLIDFSILAFWYKRTGPPPHIDLNYDTKVDIKDFSVMAYHWSG